MARSTYIYLIFHVPTNDMLAAFTVKYEANDWATDSRWPITQLQLYRTRDGERHKHANALTAIPWTKK